MIKAENLTKRFYDTVAVDHIHAEIHNGSVFGLIGTNGAGKSTFLRMAAGILKPDEGSITVDDETVFENTKVKARCFYIPDEPYFLSNGTAEDMKVFYQGIYPKFDAARFDKLLKNFELESRRKVQTFSKGMKKQLAVLLGICAGTDYLFCDETFDGLDPVMRQTVKSLFANDIEERNLTPVIASHNLRELEDICDHVCLLHNGNIRISSGLDDLVENLHRIRCVFSDEKKKEDFSDLDIVSFRGARRMCTLTVRGVRSEITAALELMDPVSVDIVPLSLEEIFVYEMEAIGYDAKKITF